MTFRVMGPHEWGRFAPEAWGHLLRLSDTGALNGPELEQVIERALAHFDGTALYEHEDPRLGFHEEWGTHIFNYGRNEVKSFLMSSAHFWLAEFHFDGLRVDAVASILDLEPDTEGIFNLPPAA